MKKIIKGERETLRPEEKKKKKKWGRGMNCEEEMRVKK
jgi:hypothetical protein